MYNIAQVLVRHSQLSPEARNLIPIARSDWGKILFPSALADTKRVPEARGRVSDPRYQSPSGDSAGYATSLARLARARLYTKA
jgi:hypothetical protein